MGKSTINNKQSTTCKEQFKFSKINYQHKIASRQSVFVVSKIMIHNSIIAGKLQVKQYSSDTVIFIVPYPKHFYRLMITAFKFIEAISNKARP